MGMQTECITAPKGTNYLSDLCDRLVFSDRFNDKDFNKCILDKGRSRVRGNARCNKQRLPDLDRHALQEPSL